MDLTKKITDIKDFITNPSNTSSLITYAGLFAVILVAFIILSVASNDPTALSSKSYVYALSIIVPLILIIGYVFPFAKAQSNPFYILFIIIMIFIFFISLFYSYSSMNLQTFTAISYGINYILLMIIFTGLAIFFYIFSSYLKSQDGYTGFIVNFIFYIPCLLIDFAAYIKREFDLTPNVVFILFIAELLLLLSYNYVPKLIDYMTYSDGIVILKDSMFLDSEQVIGNSQQFIMPSMSNQIEYNNKVIYRKNYAVSMWIYLNTGSSNNASYAKETTIFDYGNGKPKITYYNNPSADKHKDKYIIYFTNKRNGEMNYELTLPSQKWNYFVFNFSSTNADLFINGNLERTFTFTNNRPTYHSTDNVKIGSNNGLNGAISNIRYYTTPLSSSQVANSYNLLMYKNPPTN